MTVTPMRGRPTLYRGIRMRSRLEASVARWLDHTADQCGHTWQYEPECFAGPAGDYLPDFYEWQPCVERGGYIEVKPWKTNDPQLKQRDEYDRYIRRMEIIHESYPRAVLILLPWSWDFVPKDGEEWTDRHGPRLYILNRGRGWTVTDRFGHEVPW